MALEPLAVASAVCHPACKNALSLPLHTLQSTLPHDMYLAALHQTLITLVNQVCACRWPCGVARLMTCLRWLAQVGTARLWGRLRFLHGTCELQCGKSLLCLLLLGTCSCCQSSLCLHDVIVLQAHCLCRRRFLKADQVANAANAHASLPSAVRQTFP